MEWDSSAPARKSGSRSTSIRRVCQTAPAFLACFYRSTDGAAVLVDMQRCNLRSGPVGKEAVGIQGVVAEELEGVTVKVVGPRLGDHGRNPAAAAAVSGGVAVGLHTH